MSSSLLPITRPRDVQETHTKTINILCLLLLFCGVFMGRKRSVVSKSLLPITRPGDVQETHTKTIHILLFLFSCWWTVLWDYAASSRRLFSLACTEENGERYLRAVVDVKPAWGTAITFLGSATARPLEANRLRSALLQSALHRLFTRKERRSVSIMICYMNLCQLILLCKLSILSEIAVALLFVFRLNLKSDFVKRIFPP